MDTPMHDVIISLATDGTHYWCIVLIDGVEIKRSPQCNTEAEAQVWCDKATVLAYAVKGGLH